MNDNTGVSLGLAKKQALDYLIAIKAVDFEHQYKDMVKFFYRMNQEIDLELKVGVNPTGNIVRPNVVNGEKRDPSANQKRCPKCYNLMPKTWKRHDACGWVE